MVGAKCHITNIRKFVQLLYNMKKKVTKFGQRGAHILVPKKYVGQTVEVILPEKGKKDNGMCLVDGQRQTAPSSRPRKECTYFNKNSCNCSKLNRTCDHLLDRSECKERE